MMRLLGTPAGAVLLSKLRIESQTAFPRLVGINEVGTQIGFYFEDADVPAQSAVDAVMAAHTATPLPPTPEQLQIAADKNTVTQFMNAPSGSATPAQRDDTIKAVIRYLRRRGDDA